ncbi:MAG TPA: tRNA (guanosine(46)-N7)-methyltransferase TrmB [Burkholderiales bacterium]|nr:tRNA (guanosine(46)-N7)-methyltransferase TrmB [Burkholderiales bacterium]
MSESDMPHRAVRSFVLRQGRVSNAQGRAHAQLLPVYGLPFGNIPLDFKQVYGRDAPTVLEIGFGMGETTAAIAAANPETNYLAIEVHTPGVGSLLKQIEEQGLSNLRIVQHDAVEVLERMIAPESLAGAHIFFPDPWPKKRHRKRRLIQGPLIALLSSRLYRGAYLHAATDWEDYAHQILEVFTAEPTLENTASNFAPRPTGRPQTKFESRGLRLGHGVWDILFRKR